ncbi:MAG TPA: WXG100 family type VII secretion target [Actinophytocola sp.]|uniref:WXG100 family type VII secretion target n=1 Tax=Actinophytocola sp. TaxID=1872138 RepID=UPI002DDCF57A|nr:WXG100 family type VII secretion target [Actinophytocola sp.]HEV2781453.1 WXG100 family type VII secretion target [Actinophytocola sp.]
MSKSWPEVKRMLDDPYVSADTKERLLTAYMMENYNIPDEARAYYDRYKLGDDDDAFDVIWDGDSTDDIYSAAERETQQRGYHDRQVEQQIQENQGQLGSVQAPNADGGGVATSDELFDLARPALAVFEAFIPIDAKVPGDSRGVNGPADFNRDIVTRFDEQRGINFRKMMAEAARLAGAHNSLSELKSTTESQLNSLYQKWSGPAANASYEHYTRQIDPNVNELLPYLERGPQVIQAAVDTVFQACKSKAEQVMRLYRQTVGSATPDIADKVMKLARGEFSDQDEILPVAAWVDSVCGSNLEERIRTDNCGLNDGNKQYTIEQCKKWIRESFNVEFWGDSSRMGMMLQFKKICDDTVEAVDGAWQTVNDFFKPYQSEFAQAGSGTGITQPGASVPGGGGYGGTQVPGVPGGGGGGTGGAGTGGGGGYTPPPVPPAVPTPPAGGGGAGTGGGGMGGGNGTGPSGVPSVPSVPTPSVPSVPIPGTGSGTNPSLSGPGGTDPSFAGGQTPGGVPGIPDPSRPGGGGGGVPPVPIPGAGGGGLGGGGLGSGVPGLPGPGGEPKTVSIQDGNRTITVSEPDAHGRSKITIDDGKGHPKTFTMDFGDAQKLFGGGTPELPEGIEGELVKAGEDGKVVIKDGDTTITAERVPGEPDKIKLTVDDGTGEPKTYTVDFNTPTPGGSGLGSFTPSGRLGDLPRIDIPASSASSFGGGGVGGGGGFGGGGGGVPSGGSGGGSLEGGVATGAQAPAGEQRAAAVASGGGSGGGGDGGGGRGGMGMPMGAMGAAAGQGGGDQTRGGSKWRTTGQLFDDDDPAAHFSGVVGEDPAQRAARPTKKS